MHALSAPLGALVLVGAGWLPFSAEGTSPPLRPDAELDQLVERYNSARRDMSTRMNAAENDAAASAIYLGMDWRPFLDEFRELAYEKAGTEAAGQAWMWIIRIGRQDFVERATEAVDVLAHDHIDDLVLGELASSLEFAGALKQDFVRASLSTILEGSPHRSVQAAAQLTLGRSYLAEGADDASRAKGRALIEGVVSDYADIEDAAKNAGRFLYELDNLLVGMRAPDFETIDQDGVPFKLSDYRGKVVVIDFWGFW